VQSAPARGKTASSNAQLGGAWYGSGIRLFSQKPGRCGRYGGSRAPPAAHDAVALVAALVKTQEKRAFPRKP
jgi:hypothetical protein